ncbi:MAG: PepSY domain-containing protein [Betaproteobacteria bacterium]
MKYSSPVIAVVVTAVTASIFSLTAAAHGDVKCDSLPKSEWKKQIDLQKKLTDEGWKVRQVKTENNCYEVYGFDEKGNRVEAFFHPKTFERVTSAADQPAKK